MANVFTLLFHGTQEHRDKGLENQEALHELTKMLPDDQEYRTWLVLDGPGATPPRGQTANPLPGSFQWDSREKLRKVRKESTAILDYNDESKPYVKWLLQRLPLIARGNLMGEGMDDNIRHAIVAIANVVCDLGDEPFTVNLVGWSRGGVSCIRAANWLTKIFPERITLNAFTFDPVPGADLGDKIDDTKTLPSRLVSYVSILCLHDKRSTFGPVDLNMLRVPDIGSGYDGKVSLLLLPGFHSTPLYFAANQGRLHGPAEIGRYLARKFLHNHFTDLGADELNPASNFTAEKICETYAKMMLNLDDYGKMDWTTYFYQRSMTLRLTDRRVLHERQRYLVRSKSQYFVNEHHVTAFLRTLPTLSRHLGILCTAPSIGIRMQQAGAAAVDIAKLRLRMPLSLKLLWSLAGSGATAAPPPDWLPPGGLLAPEPAPPRMGAIDQAITRGFGQLETLVES